MRCSFYVERDTLFSYHKVSEVFLQRVMSLYVSSHYKNSPNDLMLMSDAPAHHLFVLLPPTDESTRDLPQVLCVIQVILYHLLNYFWRFFLTKYFLGVPGRRNKQGLRVGIGK